MRLQGLGGKGLGLTRLEEEEEGGADFHSECRLRVQGLRVRGYQRRQVEGGGEVDWSTNFGFSVWGFGGFGVRLYQRWSLSVRLYQRWGKALP